MKMLLTTVALSVALATPALSQTADRTEQSAQNQRRTYDYNAYAQEREMRVIPRPGSSRSANPRNDVYGPHGEYVGSDPDPRIRDQLRQDPAQGRE